MPTDPLTRLLGADDSHRPRLVWYSDSERIELTGHVLAMWLSKTAGLIDTESQPPQGLHLGAPLHWRTVAWACGAWLAGREVILGSGPLLAEAGIVPGLSMAFTPEELCPSAEAQALCPQDSLAVRWPGRLPPLVLDGAADLMSQPDSYSPAPAQPHDRALTRLAPDGSLSSLTRAELLDGLVDAGGADAARAADPAGSAGPAGPAGPAGRAEHAGRARAVLVRRQDRAGALREVLGAWGQGRCAVILAPGTSRERAALAARQEGC